MEQKQLKDIARILAALAASVSVVYDKLLEHDIIDPVTKACIIAAIDKAFEGKLLAVEEEEES